LLIWVIWCKGHLESATVWVGEAKDKSKSKNSKLQMQKFTEYQNSK